MKRDFNGLKKGKIILRLNYIYLKEMLHLNKSKEGLPIECFYYLSKVSQINISSGFNQPMNPKINKWSLTSIIWSIKKNKRQNKYLNKIKLLNKIKYLNKIHPRKLLHPNKTKWISWCSNCKVVLIKAVWVLWLLIESPLLLIR